MISKTVLLATYHVFLYYKASLDIYKVHLKSARKEHQKSTHKAPPTINYKQLQQHIS